MKKMLLVSIVGGACISVSAQQSPNPDTVCNVTAPNGIRAGLSQPEAGSYGNALLSVFGLWPNGTLIFQPRGPGFMTRDNGLGMKFGWMRGVRGKLKVTGRRLDGAASPLRLIANDGYGVDGFQASYLIFSTPGCWEVNAQVDEREDSRITFITRVVKIGEGPSRWDPSH